METRVVCVFFKSLFNSEAFIFQTGFKSNTTAYTVAEQVLLIGETAGHQRRQKPKPRPRTLSAARLNECVVLLLTRHRPDICYCFSLQQSPALQAAWRSWRPAASRCDIPDFSPSNSNCFVSWWPSSSVDPLSFTVFGTHSCSVLLWNLHMLEDKHSATFFKIPLWE